MSHAHQQTQQKFAYSYRHVFQAVLWALRDLGMTVKSRNVDLGRITASAPPSLFSWGQNVTLCVERVDDKNSIVVIDSGLKWALDVAGGGRHQLNFERILEATYTHLRGFDEPMDVLPAD